MTLRDDTTKHRIFVQRLAGTEAKNIKEQLKALNRAAKLQYDSGVSTRVMKSKLRSVVKSLPDIAIDNLTDIAVYESKFAAKVFNKHLAGDFSPVDEGVLRKALVNTNIAVSNVHIHKGDLVVNEASKAKSLKTAYAQFGNRKADELVQILKDAKLNNLTRVETFKLLDDRLAGLHSTQADTLATTSVNYATNVAKDATVEENKDKIEQVQWVATLEENTCGYCEDNHNEVFDVSDAPDCPAHWNCNCELIPYVEI